VSDEGLFARAYLFAREVAAVGEDWQALAAGGGLRLLRAGCDRATGIAHANSHSVLAGATGGTPLTGVSLGMPLLSNGTQVGSVYRVVTANGVITRVLVQGPTGGSTR
jgi:hypothetical protein